MSMTALSDRTLPRSSRQSGFSLLEVTIVLAVLAVVLAGVLPYLTEATKSKDADETITRLDKIEEALLGYYLERGFIPCPSDISAPLSANPGLDWGGQFGVADAVGCATITTMTSGTARGGGVPTRTLDLPDEYAFDGWGRRITYNIDTSANQTGYPTGSGLTVNDGTGGSAITSTAGYVLISHGPNGHGAYLRGGEASNSVTRLDSGSTNTDEWGNCDNNLTGGVDTICDSGGYDAIFVKKSSLYDTAGDERDFFDDIVRFRSRVLIKNAFGGAALLPIDCDPNEGIFWDGVAWDCTSDPVEIP